MKLNQKISEAGIPVHMVKLSVDQEEEIEIKDIMANMMQLLEQTSHKTVLFGHSMGGILILKLLESLSTQQLNKIAGLVFSSSTPPNQLKTLQAGIPPVQSEEFIHYLLDLGNLSREHFEDSFFIDYILERMKRDFSLLKDIELNQDLSYYNRIFEAIPTLVLRGNNEKMHEKYLLHWEDYAQIQQKALEGNHFYFQQNTDQIVQEITKRGEQH